MSKAESKKADSALAENPKKTVSKASATSAKAPAKKPASKPKATAKPKAASKPKVAAKSGPKPKPKSELDGHTIPPEIFDQMMEYIMGGMSIADVCRKKGMPPRIRFYRALNADEKGDLRGRYDDACAIRADYLADEIVRIADDSTLDVEFKANGDIDYSKKSVERSKLMIDARKWTASKLRPKLWGNQVSVDLNVDASEESIQALQAIGEKNMALAMAKAEEVRRRLANQNLDDEE